MTRVCVGLLLLLTTAAISPAVAQRPARHGARTTGASDTKTWLDSLDSLQAFHTRGSRVRISGWLMLDPDHPDQVGKTRGTIWEVHPITRIEVLDNGAWRSLDHLP